MNLVGKILTVLIFIACLCLITLQPKGELLAVEELPDFASTNLFAVPCHLHHERPTLQKGDSVTGRGGVLRDLDILQGNVRLPGKSEVRNIRFPGKQGFDPAIEAMKHRQPLRWRCELELRTCAAGSRLSQSVGVVAMVPRRRTFATVNRREPVESSRRTACSP